MPAFTFSDENIEEKIEEKIEEEIVVVASRLDSTTQYISSLDRDSSPKFALVDQLRGLPGLSISRAGNHGALTQVRVRGAEANHVMVVIDGVQATDPAQGSELNFGTLSSAGVQKILLAKGPQSAVWGSDALAGVIYIDTRPVSSQKKITIEHGQHRSHRSEVNLAHVTETGFLSFDLGLSRTDGTNVALSGTERDGSELQSVNVAAQRSFGPLTLEAGIRKTHAEVEIDPIPFPLYLPVDGDYSTDTKRQLARVHADYTQGSWSSSLLMSSNTSVVGNLNGNRLETHTRGRRHTITFSNNIQLADTHEFNFTLDFERERLLQTGTPNPYGDPNQKQSLDTRSSAIEYNIEESGYQFSLAGRYDSNSDFDNVGTYRVGVAKMLGPYRVFGHFGTGSKNPTFIERFGFTPDTFYGNPELKPEKSTQIELGLQYNNLTLSVFDADLTNEINGFTFDAQRNAFTAMNEKLKSTRLGLELDYSSTLADENTIFSFAYTHLQAEQSGTTEIRRPRHSARAELTHRFSPTRRAHLSIEYNGEQTDNDFSTYPATTRQLGHFTLISGSIYQQVGTHVELYGRIENLLDTEFSELFGYRGAGFSAFGGIRLNL